MPDPINEAAKSFASTALAVPEGRIVLYDQMLARNPHLSLSSLTQNTYWSNDPKGEYGMRSFAPDGRSLRPAMNLREMSRTMTQYTTLAKAVAESQVNKSPSWQRYQTESRVFESATVYALDSINYFKDPARSNLLDADVNASAEIVNSILRQTQDVVHFMELSGHAPTPLMVNAVSALVESAPTFPIGNKVAEASLSQGLNNLTEWTKFYQQKSPAIAVG